VVGACLDRLDRAFGRRRAVAELPPAATAPALFPRGMVGRVASPEGCLTY
jgi:hypothetical protein